MYDFNATILHLMGLDHERLTYYHNGLERRLTNVHGHVVKEIFCNTQLEVTSYTEGGTTTVPDPVALGGDQIAEPYEGMLVTIPEALTVTELFQLGRFGTFKASADGQLEQFTQNNAPDADANRSTGSERS